MRYIVTGYLQLIIISQVASIYAIDGDLQLTKTDSQSSGEQRSERCAADSLATCLHVVGIGSEVVGAIEQDRTLHHAKASLLNCAEFAERQGLRTVGLRWHSIPATLSLRDAPAIMPIVMRDGRSHFIAVVGSRENALLIVDFPHRPKWVSSDELRSKWRWDGTMLHISKNLELINKLTFVAQRPQISLGLVASGLGAMAVIGILWSTRRGRQSVSVRRPPIANPRSGVTIIEILVVLGVISFLAALILPAIESARETSRNATCKNHLHQIGIALEAFSSTQGRLPAAAVSSSSANGTLLTNNIAPHVELLPYLDQKLLFDQFDRSELGAGINQDPPVSSVNGKMLTQRLAVFSCPSDTDEFGCNYRISAGTSPWMHELSPKSPRGALQGYRTLSGRRDGEFLDGKSHTAAFAEKLMGDRNPGNYTPWRDLVSVKAGPLGLMTPDDALNACDRPVNPNPKHFSFGGSTWVLSGYPQTWYNHVLPPNSSIPDCVDGGPMGHGAFSARSLHPGGVNVLFADGSIRFTSNGIDLDVWRAMGSVAGGEVISDD